MSYNNTVKMAPEKTPVRDEQQKQVNVFVRLFNLPVVSCTCEMMERTYSGTKQVHPLVSSVCEVYERGVRTAGNLAVRGIRPAIDKLEPQLIAANSLVCRGLDHLEERIPALQYSPEKLATGISEVVSSTVQTAKDGVTTPIITASDAVVSLASGGIQLTRSVLSDGALYVLNSRPVRLAEEGAGGALAIAEQLVDYILPPSADETGVEKKEGDVSKEQQSNDVSSPGPKPSLSRLSALVNTACSRAYSQTVTQIQRTSSQGQDLVARIPGVVSMARYAKQNLDAVSSTVLGLPGVLAGLFEEPQQSRQSLEGTGEPQQSGSRVKELLSGAGQQLQSAYVSVISGVKQAPKTSVGLAKDGADLVLGSLSSAKELLFTNISYYGRFSTREDKEASPTDTKEEQGGRNTPCDPFQPGQNGADTQGSSEPMEPQVSEEARLLRKKVLQDIPTQQRVVLSGSHRSLAHSSSKERSQGQTHQTTTTRSTHVIRE
ncbi:perilipin-1 isoform X2 [Alosa sapidissima]|uniref:perilipin-1 isoform X2 n=1 Tax=Alosa sapidissima TaxID=34773 RepID=UPI001C095364|nr:perilipin-1 isoform X2 [Alosa sapidissima]